jgi:hypothetical protein
MNWLDKFLHWVLNIFFPVSDDAVTQEIMDKFNAMNETEREAALRLLKDIVAGKYRK